MKFAAAARLFHPKRKKDCPDQEPVPVPPEPVPGTWLHRKIQTES